MRKPLVVGNDDAGDIRWVMDHLRDAEVSRKDAPSRTAWSLLEWSRSDAKAETSFVTQVYGKAFVSRDAEERQRRDRRSEVELTGMISRCLESKLRSESVRGPTP